jgi:hypothetical protein
MKNTNYLNSDFCKFHKLESDFVCSCGDLICISCIENHKTHNDFVLKHKKNVFQELNNEIKELELNYEYLTNSFLQEKVLIKITKELTNKFFRKELKNTKDKEILKILGDVKNSLHKASMEYKYDFKMPENLEIKTIKLMIEKAKRNFFKKINKIQDMSDKILYTKNLYEIEYEKLLSKLFTENVKMDIDENEQRTRKKTESIIDCFQFTIGPSKRNNLKNLCSNMNNNNENNGTYKCPNCNMNNFNPESTDKLFSPLQKEFVQSFYSNREKEKKIEDLDFERDKISHNRFNEIKINHYEEIGNVTEKNSDTKLKSKNFDIQIPIHINNTTFNSDFFDDKISVGKEIEIKKDIVINSIFSQNQENNKNTNYRNKLVDETRPASLSNLSRSPIGNRSPLHNNRVNSIFDSEIDMLCMNPNCRRAYKVKKGEEKWKKKCLTCYKIEKS